VNDSPQAVENEGGNNVVGYCVSAIVFVCQIKQNRYQWCRKQECKRTPKSFDLLKIWAKSLKNWAKSLNIWAKFVNSQEKYLKILTNYLQIRAKIAPNVV